MAHVKQPSERPAYPRFALGRLQDAYIRGQLSEHELGERIDRALSAVVRLDLDALVGDLPALPEAAQATQMVPAEEARLPWWRRRRGDRSVARPKGRKGFDVYKSTVRKNGAWSVPDLYRSRVYKGMLIIDLRQAVLSAPQAVIELEVGAYKGAAENFSTGGLPGAPRILIRGSAYKGTVVVASRDPYYPESGR